MILDLHSLFKKLENPNVRLEDNGAFKLNTEKLGIVYTRFITDVSYNHSPGMVLKRNEYFNREILEGYKKNFQSKSRDFFYKLLGALESRDKNADSLILEYSPHRKREDFSPDSIEGMIIRLMNNSQFEHIGEKLKDGAEEYHDRITKKGQVLNYHLASEYNEIFQALRG
ncbi:hypothetical protein HYX11_02070 [Candidatus Woesearchaeota archaeon]|nr:hypothetical protein [Candidatus Woesearchaeota archaeon]